MLTAFGWMARREWRDRYPSTPLGLVSELLSMLLGLGVYWFTAKALNPGLTESLRPFGGDYFSYLLVGDLFLIVPLALAQGIASTVRKAAWEGTLDVFRTEPVGPRAPILLAAISGVPRDIGRAIAMLIAAYLMFGFRLPVANGFGAAMLVVLGAPAFLGVGMLWGAALIRFGRGTEALAHFTAVSAVLAGSYFPLSVLPAFVVRAAVLLLPFATLLESVRSVLVSGWTPELAAPVATLALSGIALAAVGYLALGASLESLRRSGRNLLPA